MLGGISTGGTRERIGRARPRSLSESQPAVMATMTRAFSLCH